MGMDPYDVFVPDNRLVATTESRRVPIARCTCGEYGCGATDVSIVRDGHNPTELAELVVRSLKKRPSAWHAGWHAVQPGLGPPPLAGRRWRQYKLR